MVVLKEVSERGVKVIFSFFHKILMVACLLVSLCLGGTMQVYASPIIKEQNSKNGAYSYDPDKVNELRNSVHPKVVVLDPKDKEKALEGEYAFVPRYYKGRTTATLFLGSTEKIIDKAALTLTKADVAKGATIVYKDVGFYQGRKIDLVQEVLSISDKATFGMGLSTGLLYSRFLGISATGKNNTDQVKVKYTFKYQDTQEQAKISGYLSFTDIDREEAISVSDTNIENVYVLNNSQVVGDMVNDNELSIQAPKRNSSWWGEDEDWNVESNNTSRWVSVTFKNTDSINIAVTTSTTEITESTVGYASELLLPLNYPTPDKVAINTNENQNERKIQYSIISQVPAKVVPVPEPKYQIKDQLPPQFKVDTVSCIDSQTGEKKAFDISIEGSNLVIDGKKFLNEASFYDHIYEFIVTGSYTEGKLNHFESVPGDDDYVNIPNIADLVVSNTDETDRILKTNEANAPVLLIAGDVTVKYLDEATKKSLSPDIILKGDLKQTYETKAKEIEGYTLKKVPENAQGNFKKQDQEVQYTYVKNQPEVVITKTSLLNKTYHASNHSEQELIKTAMKDQIELTNYLNLKKNTSQQYNLIQNIAIPLHSTVKKIQFKGQTLTADRWSETNGNNEKQLEINIPVDSKTDPNELETPLVISFEIEKGYSEGERVPILKEKNTIQLKETTEKTTAINSVNIEMTTNLLSFKAETLDYGKNDVSSKTELLNRKNDTALLAFSDTRRETSNLTLSVKSSSFKDNTKSLKDVELYYYADETSDSGITSLDNAIPILTTADKFPETFNWTPKQGLRLLVPAGSALVGDYTSELTWTLANVPEN